MWNPLGSLAPYAPDQMATTSAPAAGVQGWRNGGMGGDDRQWMRGLGLRGRDMRFLMNPQMMAGRNLDPAMAAWYGQAPAMPADMQAAGALDLYRQNITDWAGLRPSRGGF